MTESTQPLADVAGVIQLAVAPVFLLTAVGTILNVLSMRLARIVDRARVVVERLPHLEPAGQDSARTELRLLSRRRRLVNLAITFGTITALFVCLLIALAFVASTLRFDASVAVATLFVLAMIAFVFALVLFLREIILAVASTRMDPF